jgi:hypothetical protein
VIQQDPEERKEKKAMQGIYPASLEKNEGEEN